MLRYIKIIFSLLKLGFFSWPLLGFKLTIIFIMFFLFDLLILKIILLLLPIILSVAFFTVFERKILAAMQRRRGPNVVGIYGLLQAFADGLKLLAKETIIPSSSNMIIFILAPVLTFTLSLFS